MAHTYYPVAIDLQGKQCLVAGGGTIATDKVDGLLAVGAVVVVVSPEVSPHLAALAEEGVITLHRRYYRPSDLDDMFLVYGATDQIEVNAEIAVQARDRGILVNAVDDPPNCDFFAMAIVRRGDLQISISTNGHSPAFARWLREHLDEELPEEYGDLLSLLSEVRREVRRHGPIPPYKHWKAALGDDLLERLRQGDHQGVRAHLWTALSAAQRTTLGDATTVPARWEG